MIKPALAVRTIRIPQQVASPTKLIPKPVPNCASLRNGHTATEFWEGRGVAPVLIFATSNRNRTFKVTRETPVCRAVVIGTRFSVSPTAEGLTIGHLFMSFICARTKLHAFAHGAPPTKLGKPDEPVPLVEVLGFRNAGLDRTSGTDWGKDVAMLGKNASPLIVSIAASCGDVTGR